MRSGRRSCWSAKRMPGRAMPAAQPQTELTTSMAVPLRSFMNASTAALVRSSETPIELSSSRIGLINSELYGKVHLHPRFLEIARRGTAPLCYVMARHPHRRGGRGGTRGAPNGQEPGLALEFRGAAFMTSSPLPRPLLWWTTTADGWSLALRTYSPAGPARASLLLSPGMMLDGRAMDRPAGSGLASFFRDRGYLATTLDLRGHGSSRPRAARRVDWNFD